MLDTAPFPRPGKPMASACLIRDPAGAVLCVEPVYRPEWLMPGGFVEPGESPREAAAREVREELGIDIAVGRMLAVDHLRDHDPFGESLVFTFDGGVLADPAAIRLQAEELRSWRFLAPPEAKRLLTAGLAARLDAVLAASTSGATLYLEDGRER